MRDAHPFTLPPPLINLLPDDDTFLHDAAGQICGRNPIPFFYLFCQRPVKRLRMGAAFGLGKVEQSHGLVQG